MNNRTSFQENPVSLNTSRSKFDMPFTNSTTFKAGELVPILNYELVQPGDTFKVNLSALIRSTTPVAPVMDDAYLDIFFFFVPHKVVLNRESMSNVTGAQAAAHSFAAWLGAQDSRINVPYPTDVKLPAVYLPSSSRVVGSLWDHLNYPLSNVNPYNLFVTPWSALSYFSVWNNYFRDENSMQPVCFTVNSNSSSPSGFSLVFYNADSSVDCQSVCRRHGYFGSALPWPLRNSSQITLPIGDKAKIMALNDTGSDIPYTESLYLTAVGSSTAPWASGSTRIVGVGSNGTSKTSNIDVYADLASATGATINQVRYLFATEAYYEQLARGGNRLQEMTKALFGVTPHDLIDDVPEFLGGKSILLQNHLVANTAGTTYSTETQESIGSTGAFSLTNDEDYYFTKSFDTWGTLMCLCCVRPRESFAQGLDRQATKFDPLDLYSPVFANIGEQPIYKKELYSSGVAGNDDVIFGYQEAWAEYRYMPDRVSGYLRPGQSLDYWTYVNNFSSAPSLSSYLKGNSLYKNFDQTLQVSADTAGLQFMAQFKFIITAVRCMPTYSIPGRLVA